MKAANDYEYITMEGSGGILCPLCFDERKIQLEDVIREFELSEYSGGRCRAWYNETVLY